VLAPCTAPLGILYHCGTSPHHTHHNPKLYLVEGNFPPICFNSLPVWEGGTPKVRWLKASNGWPNDDDGDDNDDNDGDEGDDDDDAGEDDDSVSDVDNDSDVFVDVVDEVDVDVVVVVVVVVVDGSLKHCSQNQSLDGFQLNLHTQHDTTGWYNFLNIPPNGDLVTHTKNILHTLPWLIHWYSCCSCLCPLASFFTVLEAFRECFPKLFVKGILFFNIGTNVIDSHCHHCYVLFNNFTVSSLSCFSFVN